MASKVRSALTRAHLRLEARNGLLRDLIGDELLHGHCLPPELGEVHDPEGASTQLLLELQLLVHADGVVPEHAQLIGLGLDHVHLLLAHLQLAVQLVKARLCLVQLRLWGGGGGRGVSKKK
jgi:hypothetical protein